MELGSGSRGATIHSKAHGPGTIAETLGPARGSEHKSAAVCPPPERYEAVTNLGRVFLDPQTVDLFAGFPVSDYPLAAAWYERLLGCSPTFLPNDIEAVWELSEHRYLFVKVLADDAGHAFNLCFLGNLDDFIASARERGVEPAITETLENGVRRVIYKDPDGNGVGFGGSPVGA